MTTPSTPLVRLLEVQPSSGTSPINWTLERGDFWIVAGRPGAGKSELLAILAGLRAPAAGQVQWEEPPTSIPEPPLTTRRRMPRTGLVFEQGGRLLHRLTVAENLRLPLAYHSHLPRAHPGPTVETLLDFAGTTRQADALPAQLRPAERQRVALARALALRPELLLVDNPVAGLPSQEITWWTHTLTQLHRGHDLFGGQPVTLVLAGDDPRPWWSVGTRFALLSPTQWQPLGNAPLSLADRATCEHTLGLRPSPSPD